MKRSATFVIPSRDCVAWLPAAVKSAQNQTVPCDIIIVDDGSGDFTAQYLKWLAKTDSSVRVIHNEHPVGRSAARNMGNKVAQTDYIFVLDADDLAAPERVEVCLPELKKAELVHGGAEMIDSLGNVLGAMPCEPFSLDRAKEKKVTGIVHSTVAYTYDFAKKYPYSEGDLCRLGLDDWDQQMRAARDGVKFGFTPAIVSFYRNLQSAITHTRNKEEVMKAKEAVLG